MYRESIKAGIKKESAAIRKRVQHSVRTEYLFYKFGRNILDFSENCFYYYHLVNSNTIKLIVRPFLTEENQRRYFIDSCKLRYEDLYGVVWNPRPHHDGGDDTVTYTGEAVNNGVTIIFTLENAPVPPSCTKVFKGYRTSQVAEYEIICNETAETI